MERFCTLLFPLLFLLIIPFRNREQLTIYPRPDIYVSAFADKTGGTDENGQTTIDTFSNISNRLDFGFTLREGATYAYAGVYINQKDADLTWDFSLYDDLTISLKSENMGHIRVQSQSGFKGKELVRAFELELDTSIMSYRIPLSMFTVPSWWHKKNNTSPSKFDTNGSHKQVCALTLENSSYSQLNIPYSMTLSEITLKRNLNRYYWLGFLWILLLCLFEGFQRYRRLSGSKVIKYKKVILEKPEELLWERITDYIGDSYSDTELNVSKCCFEVGTTPKKMSELFRKKCTCTFKQYLNGVRLQEAHRLILKDDSQILTILLAVGFNSPSHFNRLFAKEYGISPSALRKRNPSK